MGNGLRVGPVPQALSKNPLLNEKKRRGKVGGVHVWYTASFDEMEVEGVVAGHKKTRQSGRAAS